MITLKRLAVLVLALGFSVGCASTPPPAEEEAEPPVAEKTAEEMAAEEKAAAEEAAAEEAAAEKEAEEMAAKEAEMAAKEAEMAAKEAEMKQRTMGVRAYTVEAGDNLWSISGRSEIYDDPFQWPLIYKANRHKIKDADLIYPGQYLDIERDLSEADIDAAVNHARTRGAWALGVVEDSDRAYLNR